MPAKKKKQSLISRLNLKSPKGRLIVTLIAFAAIGGGVMVYKSFAYAFSNTWIYNFSSNTLEHTQVTNSICQASAVEDPSKNNTKVGMITCNGHGAGGVIRAKGAYLDTSWTAGKKYLVCATVKGSADFMSISLSSDAFGYRASINKDYFGSSTYTEICTPEALPLLRTGDLKPQVYAEGHGYRSTLYVSHITLKETSSPLTPAPSPAPAPASF